MTNSMELADTESSATLLPVDDALGAGRLVDAACDCVLRPHVVLEYRHELEGFPLRALVLEDAAGIQAELVLPMEEQRTAVGEWRTMTAAVPPAVAADLDWTSLAGLHFTRGGPATLLSFDAAQLQFSVRKVRLNADIGRACPSTALVDDGGAPLAASGSGQSAAAALAAAYNAELHLSDVATGTVADNTVAVLVLEARVYSPAPRLLRLYSSADFQADTGLFIPLPAALAAGTRNQVYTFTVPVSNAAVRNGAATSWDAIDRVTLSADAASPNDELVYSLRSLRLETHTAACASPSQTPERAGVTIFEAGDAANRLTLLPSTDATAFTVQGSAGGLIAAPGALTPDLARFYDADCNCIAGVALSLDVALDSSASTIAAVEITDGAQRGLYIPIPATAYSTQLTGRSGTVQRIVVPIDASHIVNLPDASVWSTLSRVILHRSGPATRAPLYSLYNVQLQRLAVEPAAATCLDEADSVVRDERPESISILHGDVALTWSQADAVLRHDLAGDGSLAPAAGMAGSVVLLFLSRWCTHLCFWCSTPQPQKRPSCKACTSSAQTMMAPRLYRLPPPLRCLPTALLPPSAPCKVGSPSEATRAWRMLAALEASSLSTTPRLVRWLGGSNHFAVHSSVTNHIALLPCRHPHLVNTASSGQCPTWHQLCTSRGAAGCGWLRLEYHHRRHQHPVWQYTRRWCWLRCHRVRLFSSHGCTAVRSHWRVPCK